MFGWCPSSSSLGSGSALTVPTGAMRTTSKTSARLRLADAGLKSRAVCGCCVARAAPADAPAGARWVDEFRRLAAACDRTTQLCQAITLARGRATAVCGRHATAVAYFSRSVAKTRTRLRVSHGMWSSARCRPKPSAASTPGTPWVGSAKSSNGHGRGDRRWRVPTGGVVPAEPARRPLQHPRQLSLAEPGSPTRPRQSARPRGRRRRRKQPRLRRCPGARQSPQPSPCAVATMRSGCSTSSTTR